MPVNQNYLLIFSQDHSSGLVKNWYEESQIFYADEKVAFIYSTYLNAMGIIFSACCRPGKSEGNQPAGNS